MKKMCSIIIVLLLPVIILSGCKPYSENWVLGKTSIEIEERYGKFDYVGKEPDKNGLYWCCQCVYIAKPQKTGYFGTTLPVHFRISFNGSGIAVKCEYVTPGA